MTRTAALIPTLLALLACGACGRDGDGSGPPAPRSPVGTWTMDADHFAEERFRFTRGMAGAPESVEFFKRAGNNLTVEFREDGTWSAEGQIGPQAMTETGTWTQSGRTLTLTWNSRGGQPYAWEQDVAYDGETYEVEPEQPAPFKLRMRRKE